MPVTFGSFGDIVSLGIIIKDLVECLNNRRGSSAEYQAVVRELSSLDDRLTHVKSPCKCSEQSADLIALSMTANNCAKEYQSCIERFWEQIKIYRTCLKDGGSGSAFKDTASKVRWQVSERKRLATFRAEVNGHCSSINMLLGTMNIKLAESKDQSLRNHITQYNHAQGTTSATQDSLVNDMRSRVEQSLVSIKALASEIKSLGSRLSCNFIRNPVKKILAIVTKT
ncbi:hypothetical protein ABVK25_000180 [Lepraria finkii]|uniref:Fungal N-terminal domain-containing protein n=1 Tax=Lepraria finkii TaxID=1340010 RepID=A0ABR4BM69_9LECA